MEGDDKSKRLRDSTETLAKKQQLDAFLEVWSRNIPRMEMDAVYGGPPQRDQLLRSLPGPGLAFGSLSSMERQSLGPIDDDDVVLAIVERGTDEVSRHSRVALMADNDGVAANGAPASVVESATSIIDYRFSRNLLLPHVADLDELVARPIAKNDPALRLLVSYAAVLNDQGELAAAELRRAVSAHMHELAAVLLSGRREAQPADGLRAARLKAVKEEILQRITQNGLAVGEIARSQQISERYLRQLFAGEGTTFTDFVREARLLRAYQMLTDPAQYFRPINAIAYESGFGDLSYFNRAFRQRYNMTPSDAREESRRERRSEP
jgi:AraC-like DNA-binding protein